MNYRYTPEEIGQLNAQIDRLRELLKEVDATWPVATSELRERVRKEIQACHG